MFRMISVSGLYKSKSTSSGAQIVLIEITKVISPDTNIKIDINRFYLHIKTNKDEKIYKKNPILEIPKGFVVGGLCFR